ncbi:uncharacterized, partial [Tachysurus ichikawai]
MGEQREGPCHRVTHAQLPKGQRQEIAFGTDNFLSRLKSAPPYVHLTVKFIRHAKGQDVASESLTE